MEQYNAILALCPGSAHSYDFEGQTGVLDHSNPNIIPYDGDPPKKAACGRNAWLVLLIKDSSGNNIGGKVEKLHCEDC